MNEELTLFPNDWGLDDSPEDTTEITLTYLYYSTHELREFKALAKRGIKKLYNERYQQK